MTIEELIMEIKPFLIMPFTIAIIRIILQILISIMRGDRFIESKETNIKATEKEEQELNIDKDLMKYFNYKEQKDV